MVSKVGVLNELWMGFVSKGEVLNELSIWLRLCEGLWLLLLMLFMLLLKVGGINPTWGLVLLLPLFLLLVVKDKVGGKNRSRYPEN